MRVSEFDFELPEDRIALRPAVPRQSARLLLVDPSHGQFVDRQVGDLIGCLKAGDALVFNDTRVIPARLHGHRQRGSAIAKLEIMLHLRAGPSSWRVFARPAKKLVPGDLLRFTKSGSDALTATVIEKGEGGDVLLAFDRSGTELDTAIAAMGELPLPPYIAGKRAADAQDEADYQTILARRDGAVAAPTAGLHFTEAMLDDIRMAGASIHIVTLHVGAGTFLPVKADDTDDHRMHAEIGEIDAETADALNAVRRNGGRIVSVGTTSLRLLETAADPDGTLRPFSGETRIFISPGYRFRAVDMLFTNFHLPRSTLFMLVAAFCGLETMRAAYRHAVETGYRFYSYGDACLLTRARER